MEICRKASGRRNLACLITFKCINNEATHPMSARNSCIFFRPFIVHTRKLQAVSGEWQMLSMSDQWRKRTRLSSISKDNFISQTETASPSPSFARLKSERLYSIFFVNGKLEGKLFYFFKRDTAPCNS